MKVIEWTDKDGFLRRSMLRDGDNENFPQIGVPMEPPPVREIIESSVVELHNELMRRGLMTLKDVEDSGNALTGAILTVFRAKLINLYKQTERK